MEILHIQTQRLTIRNLLMEDLNDFFIYRSNPEVTKYQTFNVMTEIEASEFIKRQLDKPFGKAGEWVQYGIENNATGKIVGDCAIKLNADDPRIAVIGMTISHLAQRKGYAKEALSAIMAFLFDGKGLHRIEETLDAENTASVQLLKSTGFRQEGHFIENIFFKGKWGSEFQYAMLKREWDERQRSGNPK